VATVTTNNENSFENDKNGGKRYGKRQMMGTDDDGRVSGDDCTEAEASAECSDMTGKLYLSLFSLRLITGFLYYAMSTLRVCSLCVFTKGMKRWAYGNKKKGK
jgi:hypothetical protein